jgi:hypothetical protein
VFDDLRPVLGSRVLEYVTVDALTDLPMQQGQFGIHSHRSALPSGINQLLHVHQQSIIEGDHAYAPISRSREDWLLSSVTNKFYPEPMKNPEMFSRLTTCNSAPLTLTTPTSRMSSIRLSALKGMHHLRVRSGLA